MQKHPRVSSRIPRAANLAVSAFIARGELDVLDLDVFMAFAEEHESDASAQ